jgi:hypothetical protein
MKKDNIYVVIAYAGLMLFVFFYSLNLEYLKTKLMPLIVSAIGFILAVMEIIKQLREKKGKVAPASGVTQPPEAQKRLYRGYLYEIGWLLFLYGGFYVLGIIIFPIFVLVYLMGHGRKLKASLALAVLMMIASYSLFYFFKIQIPWGFLDSVL